LEFSVDGGSTWVSMTPNETEYQEDHHYNYVLTGGGYPLKARFIDSNTADNHGQFEITVHF